MICVKANIPKKLHNIDDELKAIYHSKDTVCFLFLKIESSEIRIMKKLNKKLFIKSINIK